MVFVTAAVALGLTIAAIASATGLTSWLICGEKKSLDQKTNLGVKKTGEPHCSHVYPDDPYYFTEPVVRSETIPFLSRDALKRHGFAVDPNV